MIRLVEIAITTALALSIVACAAMNRQKAQPPKDDDLHFHNLQVLPQNISRDDLIMTMKRFTQALGVQCNHCHVPLPNDPKKFDFRSDAKPFKNDARIMLRMVNTINHDYVARVPDVYTRVTCWTCHRGKTQPDIVPSLPPEPPH